MSVVSLKTDEGVSVMSEALRAARVQVVDAALAAGASTEAAQEVANAALAAIQAATQQPPLPGLVIPPHDYVALTYSGSNLSVVTFKVGGANGLTVARLDLSYTGSQLDSVKKS